MACYLKAIVKFGKVATQKELIKTKVPDDEVEKSFLRKLYGRYQELFDHYQIFVSQMTTDMFLLSLPQSRPLFRRI